MQCFVEAALYGGLASGELRGYALLHIGGHILLRETPLRRLAEGPLDHLARAVIIPTLKDDYAVLLAVEAKSAAHARGAGTKVTATGSHAVARRVTFGTETVGFFKFAIFGLRAIEYPARAVALTTEMIAVQASRPPIRTALPFSTSASVFLETPEASASYAVGIFPSLRAGSAPARHPSPSAPFVSSP